MLNVKVVFETTTWDLQFRDLGTFEPVSSTLPSEQYYLGVWMTYLKLSYRTNYLILKNFLFGLIINLNISHAISISEIEIQSLQ